MFVGSGRSLAQPVPWTMGSGAAITRAAAVVTAAGTAVSGGIGRAVTRGRERGCLRDLDDRGREQEDQNDGTGH